MNTINSDTKSDDKEETLEAIIRCIPILEKIESASSNIEMR